MTNRIGAWPWASLALFATALAFFGCFTKTKPDPGRMGPDSNPPRILADMGDPALVLIVSGELDGYFEPCGCTKGQAGGLVRRYEFIERLHRQNWPTVLIDLGGLIANDATARTGVEQARLQLQYALKALDLLKYNALALSANDLQVGFRKAMDLFRDHLGKPTKVVVANFSPRAGTDSNLQRCLILGANDVKLGITAVIDPESLKSVAEPDRSTLLTAVKRPEEVLPDLLSELESHSDYQVLMVQGSYEFAQRLANSYPGFDIVVATSESVAARSRRPESLDGGKTSLITLGRRGQYVGVFAFGKELPRRRPSYHLVALNDLYDGPGVPMKTLIQDDYRAALKAAGTVEKYPKRDFAGGPPGATYVGAATCGSCHPNTFQKWSTTKHSQAFASLLRDPRLNTGFDAECVRCHTTGFPFTSGWRSEALTPHLAGNQCENCHGPASRHVAEPDNPIFRQPLKLTTEQARSALCIGCHDHDNSVEFDFAKYWIQIEHKALDDYKGPRAHVGLKAKAGERAPNDGP